MAEGLPPLACAGEWADAVCGTAQLGREKERVDPLQLLSRSQFPYLI